NSKEDRNGVRKGSFALLVLVILLYFKMRFLKFLQLSCYQPKDECNTYKRVEP
ncbi:hypothetical protein H8959_018111, partial [Pygathrix nigripes]